MPQLTAEKIMDFVEKLPEVSPVALQLISLIDNPKTTREEIIGLIKTDEFMLAQCFKQANSAAMGARTYGTVDEIVDVLGFDIIKKVAITMAAKSVIVDKEIWFESAYLAVASEHVAQKIGLSKQEAETIYMSALFLNYGSFLLKHNFKELWTQFHKSLDWVDIMHCEREEFDWTYPEISGLVLSKLHLPFSLTNIIAKQQLVYQERVPKENVCIEIARILHVMQKADVDDIIARLDVKELKEMVAKAAISIKSLEIYDSFMENIENGAKELT